MEGGETPLIVAGHEVADWQGVLAHRVLPDGRVVLVTQRWYNTQITVSTPEEWPHTWSDGW